MYIPPIDPTDPTMFDFGPVEQNGIYELEVLDNVEGTVKSGRNEGVPKMTLTFAVIGAGVKSSFHASIGSFGIKNVMQVLCPEILETGGDVDDGALVGRRCRGLVINEVYEGNTSAKVRRLIAPAAAGEDPATAEAASPATKPKPSIKPAAGAPAAASAPAAQPEVDPWG